MFNLQQHFHNLERFYFYYDKIFENYYYNKYKIYLIKSLNVYNLKIIY